MRSIILIVLMVSATTFGGVLEPKLEDIQEAMRLWLTHCNSGKTEGQEGSAYIYCKVGRKAVEEEKEYEINVTPSPTTQKQIIFVQAPPYIYKHNLNIRGGSSPPQQTKIYVLPSKTEHTYAYQDDRDVSTAVNKPHLYFLNDNLRDESTKREYPQVQIPAATTSTPESGYQYNKPQGERLVYNANPTIRQRG